MPCGAIEGLLPLTSFAVRVAAQPFERLLHVGELLCAANGYARSGNPSIRGRGTLSTVPGPAARTLRWVAAERRKDRRMGRGRRPPMLIVSSMRRLARFNISSRGIPCT